MSEAAATRSAPVLLAEAKAAAVPSSRRPGPPSWKRPSRRAVTIAVAAGQPVALPDQTFDPAPAAT